jgi:hypothetical protein
VLSYSEIDQTSANMLLLNLKLAPATIKDFKINWVAQSGFTENIVKIIKEYKTSRKLTVSTSFYHIASHLTLVII